MPTPQLPDPSEKDSFNHRAGYGDAAFQRMMKVARTGGTLMAGEGKQLIDFFEAREKRLRKELWLHHGPGHILYGDDGEQQCNTCGIDFQNDDIDMIARRFAEQDFNRMRDAAWLLVDKAIENGQAS